MVFAPIIIPTLNRFDHLKKCVESLSKCTHADKTELIIGLDYPPTDKYREGWEMINKFLPTISGFMKIIVLHREYNMGAVANSDDLKRFVRKNHDRFIFTEDDNVFSPNFLDYMNKALEAFKDNPKILGVCGYNYAQIDMSGYDKEYYYSHEMSAWGYGSWFNDKCDKIALEIRKPDYLLKLVKNIPLKVFLNDGAKRCNLIMNIGKELYEDASCTYYEWNNDMYCVFPTTSLVRNYGSDGSGLHTKTISSNNTFITQEIDERQLFDDDFSLPVRYDEAIRKIFSSFQTGSLKLRLKKIILIIIMKCFLKIRKY